jgi:pimeloyl-ACP methyl ester carboxylesterase
MIAQAFLAGDINATLIASGLGVIQPREGDTFALLSSGVAGTSGPEPGTDFGSAGTLDDTVTLTLVLIVPEGANSLSFDFNFLSSEYPDFVGSIYNDTFTAELTDDDGTRTVAFASVNSSSFFAVSNQIAGGSGFDIFTPYPSGVDTEFGTGLPDAGLTDFISITTPINSTSGNITLTFSIGDLGDGILDSAVLIDNVSLSNFTMIDPNPDFVVNGTLITNPELLAVGGRVIRGACADGVTPVLLRAELPESGLVTFSLQGNAPEDGSLSALGAGGDQVTVTVPTVATSNGHRAYAVYHVPDEFNRGGDESLDVRIVPIQTVFSGNNGAFSSGILPLRLLRPPLVFIHGLWSDSGTWTLPLTNDLRWQGAREYVNYKSTNAAYFHINAGELPDGISSALDNMRKREMAVTQADVIGHSMGGLLSRNWVANPNYYSPGNFYEGNINRLFTMNTPHTGSPLGNLVVTIRDTPIIGGLFTDLADLLGKPIDQGALDDLSLGSTALDLIPTTPVPSHALVGTGGSSALALAPGYLGALYQIVFFFSEDVDIFQGLQHDFIVGRNSQEGGIALNAQTVFPGLDSIHTQCVGSTNYSNRLVSLLNTSPDSSSFAFFPEPFTLWQPTIPLEVDVRNSGSVFGGLDLETDVVSSVPGGQVVVTVTPSAGTTVDKVLILGKDQSVEVTEEPFQATLTIPLDFIGEYQIDAVGTNVDEDYFTALPVPVQVSTNAVVEEVTLFPTSPVLRGVGTTRSIQVIGRFSDGVSRDITTSATTQYLIDDPSIFTINGDGVITAVSEGISTLVAVSGDVQDSVTVTILPECSISQVFYQRMQSWPETESVLTLIPFSVCQ